MIPFLRLTPGEDTTVVREAITRVVERGWFVLGPELEGFEREFAAASGAGFCGVGMGGTNAESLMVEAPHAKPGGECRRLHALML